MKSYGKIKTKTAEKKAVAKKTEVEKPKKEKKLTKPQLKLIEEQEFQNQILDMLDKGNEYILIKTVTELKKVLKKLGHAYAIDTETNGLDTRKGYLKLYGISLSNETGKAFWLLKPSKAMCEVLAQNFKKSHLIMANATYDIDVLEVFDMPVHKFSDVLIGVHLVWPNNRPESLKNTALKRCSGIGETLEMHRMLGKSKKDIIADDFLLLSDRQQRVYGCQDADLTWRLWMLDEVTDMMIQNKKIWKLEHSQVRPLIHMRSKGVTINVDLMNEQDKVLEQAFEKLNKQINIIATEHYKTPTEINLRSPMQKSDLMFGKFTKGKNGNPGTHDKRTALSDVNGNKIVPFVCSDVGRGSTQKKYVHTYRDICPAVDIMLLASSFASLRSNFTNKIPSLLYDDGKLRGSLWSTGASTGRYTSSNPNLQNIATCSADNIPVDIRNAFCADPGWVFINPDYSQIELRLSAGFSNEPVWINAFLKGESPHIATAIKMFGENYKDDQYKKAKNLNFAVLYGQTAYAVAMAYGISEKEAQKFIDLWFDAVPKLVKWIERTKVKCRNLGFASTLWDRRRPMKSDSDQTDSIKSSDPYTRASWERRAVNSVIQGTAADIMKEAINRCYLAIQKVDYPVEMLLTVHDELLFHTPKKYAKFLAKLVEENMLFPIDLPVPLAIDIGVGETWSTCTLMRDFEGDENPTYNEEEDNVKS